MASLIKSLRFCIFATLLIGVMAEAAELQAITPEKVADLRQQFASSKVPQISLWRGALTNCTVYGMKSKMLVESNLKLYRMEELAGDQLSNSGFLRVTGYRSTENAWVGQRGILKDFIRQRSDGKLMAELTLPHNEETHKRSQILDSVSESGRWTLSFAVCDKN